MGRTSYAQNFEDIMLWRALGHVTDGFYVDVGANDPTLDSVTKLFYDAGWHGINIEPVEQWFKKLEKDRPRDLNIKTAAGSKRGKVVLYDLPDTGLCTHDESIAERHERDRGYKKQAFTVSLTPLTDIFDKHCDGEIHFLKIDVETAELDVIKGLDLQKYRPWIIVVESTLPNLRTENFNDWEAILLGADYNFAYFDSLNRFYVADEKLDELNDCFDSPPNIFDNFELARFVSSQERVADLTQDLVVANNEVAQLDQSLIALKLDYAEAEARAVQAEDRATQAEARAVQAEDRAVKAEALATQADLNVAAAQVLTEDANSRAKQAEHETNEVSALLNAARREVHDLHQSNHHHWQLAEATSDEILALRKSFSWRLTAPARFIARPFYGRQPTPSNIHKTKFFNRLIQWGMARPRLVRFVHVYVDLIPPIRWAIHRRVSAAYSEAPNSNGEIELRSQDLEDGAFTEHSELSPRAKRIYADLKKATELNGTEKT